VGFDTRLSLGRRVPRGGSMLNSFSVRRRQPIDGHIPHADVTLRKGGFHRFFVDARQFLGVKSLPSL